MLKGYFSAVTEGKDTTVVYVWDVYDPAGNRLHRINGQMKAPSVASGSGATDDSWKAVSPATMQRSPTRPSTKFAASSAARPADRARLQGPRAFWD
jgi:hypothetical protein